MELEVPANLYGMAIAEPPQLSVKHDGKLMCVLEICRVFAMLFINYAVCGLFVLYVVHMNADAEPQCGAKLVVLEFVCIFTFEVRMLADLEETLTMASLLWFAPPATVEDRSRLSSYVQARDASPRTGAVLQAKEEPRRGWFRRNKEAALALAIRRERRAPMSPRASTSRRSQAEPSAWKLEGLSRTFRIWSVLVVTVPKLLLGLAVAYVGGAYIVKSQDEEAMVMSTLAVVFVADIDDILYTAFTSSVMRYHLENTTPVQVELSNSKRLAMWVSSSVLAPTFCVALSLLVMWHIRKVHCYEGWTREDLTNSLWQTFQISFTV